jgi:hypothetical protein
MGGAAITDMDSAQLLNLTARIKARAGKSDQDSRLPQLAGNIAIERFMGPPSPFAVEPGGAIEPYTATGHVGGLKPRKCVYFILRYSRLINQLEARIARIDSV